MNRPFGAILLLVLIAGIGFLSACVAAHPSYEVLSLNMAPTTVTTGEKVAIKVEVKNINSQADTYTIPLMVDGVADSRKSVTLAPGQTELLTFDLTINRAGSYKISVGGKESSLKVEKASPPDFRLSNLEISPTSVDLCENVVITADLVNNGASQGDFTAVLKIDGITNQIQKLAVPAGANCILCFKVSKGLPGTYKVVLGDLAGEFVVKEPPAPVFDVPIYQPCPPSDEGSCSPRG